MAATLLAKGSRDTDPGALEVRLGTEGPKLGLHSGPSGDLRSPQSSQKEALPASAPPSVGHAAEFTVSAASLCAEQRQHTGRASMSS